MNSANVITTQMLEQIVKGTEIHGVLLLKDYKTAKTKTNADYIVGSLMSGATFAFKAWGSSKAFEKLKNADYTNMVCLIKGVGDEYNDSKSIVLDDIDAVDGYEAGQFMAHPYNTEAYWAALQKLVKARVSEKGYALCDKILFNNPQVAERFKEEFAAKNYHDNCVSGLLAHTYKVVSLMNSVITMYGGLTSIDGKVDNDYRDLFYMGALLHDIGKIHEMSFGAYQPNSIVTHRMLGYEMLLEYKKDIIESYNEYWFYELVGILQQHHDEYGDKAKTVASLIVHFVDNLDAQISVILQQKGDKGYQDTIKLNDSYYTI